MRRLLWVINKVRNFVENSKVAAGISTKSFSGKLPPEEMHVIIWTWSKYKQSLS